MQPQILKRETSFSFWKALIFTTLFFVITPVALGASLISLILITNTTELNRQIAQAPPNLIQVPKSGVRVYASLPSSFPTISGEVQGEDARVELVRQYLASFNSPLEPYAGGIIEAADKYELDFRLTTAVAQQESNLCRVIPAGSYNCWGWGIHSQGTLAFDSFEEGIEEVSKGIKENYIDEGLVTTEEIMGKYTPLSPGSWANGVNKFMSQMQ